MNKSISYAVVTVCSGYLLTMGSQASATVFNGPPNDDDTFATANVIDFTLNNAGGGFLDTATDIVDFFRYDNVPGGKFTLNAEITSAFGGSTVFTFTLLDGVTAAVLGSFQLDANPVDNTFPTEFAFMGMVPGGGQIGVEITTAQQSFSISESYGFDLEVVPTPAPGVVPLMLAGLAGLGALRRAQKRPSVS